MDVRKGGERMRVTTKMIREGYDGKKCLVHAGMCIMPEGKIISTAQNLKLIFWDMCGIMRCKTRRGEAFL